MSFGYDSSAGLGATTTIDASWTHTPIGSVHAVLVGIAQYTTTNVTPNDQVVGVTYGGVAMDRIDTAAGTSGSSGQRSYLYKLTSEIPQGAQTVAVDVSGSQVYTASSAVWESYEDIPVVVVDSTSGYANNATVIDFGTLSPGGKQSYGVVTACSTETSATQLNPVSGWSSRREIDMGSYTTGLYETTTMQTTDFQAQVSVSSAWASGVACVLQEAPSILPAAPPRGFPRPILNF